MESSFDHGEERNAPSTVFKQLGEVFGLYGGRDFPGGRGGGVNTVCAYTKSKP
jgi:hypothetical protein